MMTLKRLFSMLALLALTACGGGSGTTENGSPPFGGPPGGGGGGGGGSGASASDLGLILSKTVVSNSGTETVMATVFALDGNRNSVADVPVVVKVDSGAFVTPSDVKTDSTGQMTATITLPQNPANGIVTVTAVSGSIVRAGTFLVTGTGGSTGQQATDLAVLLDKSIIGNSGTETVKATVIALDTNRNALSGVPVSIKVNSDAIATVNGTTTDATGQITANISLGTNLTNRSVTVTATNGPLTRTAVFQVADSGGSSTVVVKEVQIRLSATSVDNSGTENIVANVTAVDANGKGLGGVPITLSVDKNATFSFTGPSGGSTAADGTVTANITIGNDYSLRTITVAATGGAVTRNTTFAVTGTRLVASDLALVLTSPTIPNTGSNSVTATVTALDANRNVLPNVPVSLTVDSSAFIAPSGPTTGANGTVTGVLNIGSDRSNRLITITAVSGTVTRVARLEVVGAKLAAAPSSTSVQTGATASINYVLTDNAGGRMGLIPLTISATGKPTLNAITDANGEYVYRYTAPVTAQTLNVRAIAAGAPADVSIAVVGTVVIPPAGTVTAPSVSSNPSVVAVNATGSTSTNKVEIRALFLAANNLPVPNVRVWFDLNGDQQSIGGTLDSTAGGTWVYSDANGVARTSYAPGTRFSPKDGVTIRACWGSTDFTIPSEGGACARQVTTTLTVISDALSVSIGTNGTIEIGPSGLTYIKRYAVQVVDSAGNAKPDVNVASSIDLLQYFKGEWRIVGDFWVKGGRGTNYPNLYSPSGLFSSTITLPNSGNPVPFSAALPRPPNTFTVNWLAGNSTSCENEDLNRNGVVENFLDSYETLQVSEDQNRSANLAPPRPALDPRKADVSISAVGPSTTDADGIVVLKIEYPQNVASWVDFNILVSASGVAGTEGRANYRGVLPVLAAAVSETTASPAFQLSPYGAQGSDAYPRKNPQGQSGFLCTNPN